LIQNRSLFTLSLYDGISSHHADTTTFANLNRSLNLSLPGDILSEAEVKKLLGLPQRTRGSGGGGRGTPGTTRSKTVNIDDRSFPMWWRLPVTLSNCECKNHDEEEAGRRRMCALVDDIYICRYCYVNSRDK